MKNIVVIFGGVSVEHDVSIITALKVCKLLRRTYNIIPVYLSLENKFYYLKDINFSDYNDKNKLVNFGKRIEFLQGSIYYCAGKKLKELFKVDGAINCCHGGVGESGELAGFLKLNRINLSCSSSNAICLNKYITKQFAKSLGINVIDCELVTNNNLEEKLKIIKQVDNKQFLLKPNTLGSSIGIIKSEKKDLGDNVELLLHLDGQILVEEYIKNIEELRVAIVNYKNTICLSEVEKVKLKNDIYSFEDKYINKLSVSEIPANISGKIKNQIFDWAKKLYEGLNLAGVVEFQFFYVKSKDLLYFNEINAVPKNLSLNLFEPIGITAKMMAEYLIEGKESIKKQTYFESDILK